MLSRLSIRNFAIIDQLSISFSPELNIITGETGAGKSILVGALSLLLGQRADTRSLFSETSKCSIEGVFKIGNYQLEEFFQENDLDYEPETILRREISQEGKSRAFINDTPVTLNILKELGYLLVDIHSQHETLDINTEAFQFRLTDLVAGQAEELGPFRKELQVYLKTEKTIRTLLAEMETNVAERDYVFYQLKELSDAKIEDPAEQELLELELKELSHAEEIKRGLEGGLFYLDETESSVLSRLNETLAALHSIDKFYSAAGSLIERMRSCQIELKDIQTEIAHLSENLQVDNERLGIVQDRLNLLYKLSQKHRVSQLSELMAIQAALETKLSGMDHSEEHIEELKKLQETRKNELAEKAGKFSEKRKHAVPIIEKEISSTLAELGIPDAQFSIEQQLHPETFSVYGIDGIRFLFSANKGFRPNDLSKVASGGELSRLMLAIKSLSSKYASMPTIIFDEIDTGVSGEVALKVGRVMERLSASNQVIAITHLPQIASRGNSHYFVYKDSSKGVTTTNLRKLEESEREMEIAKMLSGNEPGEFALKNARELLERM